ncbi:MAG TPA: alkaline ceramidase [Firmicutes bacterium]|jgi:hypothetical protein|nr:alkaline ceramidase [Bacillota bacterium]
MNPIKDKVCLGYAEVDITPTVPMELEGFDRPDNISRGILDKLIAQIVIWDDQARKSCIITLDSLGFTVEKANILREAIGDKLHIGRERIMVCFSHTHSAPSAGREKAYFDFVCTQILGGVDSAIGTLSPVKAVWGITEADIGMNRRNKNGRLDRRIIVLKITDTLTDRLKLVLLRLTAHANVLTSDNYLISADFFGTTRKMLENKYYCKVMLTQGASGNVRPKYQHSEAVFMEEHPHDATAIKKSPDIIKKRLDESLAALHKMATEISNAIGPIIENLTPQIIDRVDMISETKSFFADLPTMKRAGEIADEAMREAGIDGTNWIAEVKKLYLGNIRRQSAEVEMQYFILNNGCWCGVANEVMCEIALDISEKVDDQLLYFGGYTNGCNGYLPSAEEYQKGGYEVLWSYLTYYQYHGRVMPLNCDTADRLIRLITAKWKQLQDEPPAHALTK